ncbi:gp032 [Rhodococcus phage ReqiPepy6]|uniref:Gp032 n=1 Tax=Rhodococcus phage ReqiPepy6 TaxID=691965 RepID=D4P7E3_9CAUD|nr:gp032 [Rhodococcus phage ReqiPepy6]ADD80923.1 gp032 [Rhodococcus phage ReqiPepy6]
MSIITNGVNPSAVYSGGNADTMILAGAGSGVLEQFPYNTNVTMSYDFANPLEEKWFPISGFDSRTSINSDYRPGMVIGGNYISQVNADHTHHVRLLNRQMNGNILHVEVVIANQLFSLALPSYLVLASNPYANVALIAEFGNNGVRVFPISGATVQTQYRHEVFTPIAVGNRLRISWIKDWVTVYVNDVAIESFYEPYYRANFRNRPGFMYPGIGLYSGPNSVYSTPIGKVTFSGSGSSMATTLEHVAQAYMSHIDIPLNAWTEVARVYTNLTSGTARVQLLGAMWKTNISTSTRNFRMSLNGTVLGTITDRNGGTLDFPNTNVPANSVLTAEAFTNSSTAVNRVVGAGTLRVGL